MTKESWFKKEVTLGNIIQIGSILVSVLICWVKLDGRVQNLEKAQTVQTILVEKVTDSLNNLSRNQERLSAILEERARKEH